MTVDLRARDYRAFFEQLMGMWTNVITIKSMNTWLKKHGDLDKYTVKAKERKKVKA